MEKLEVILSQDPSVFPFIEPPGRPTYTPIEVELVGSLPSGKINSSTGAFGASDGDVYSGFLQVTPGEEVVVRFKATNFNTSPPIYSTGIAGYSSAAYNAFVAPVMNLDLYNAKHQTEYPNPIDIIEEVVTIPAGVKYVNGSTPSGSILSIRAIRLVGTLTNSLYQVYSKLNTKGTGSGSGSGAGSDNNFTDAYKERLDTLPSQFLEFRDGFIYMQDQATGERKKGYLFNSELVWDVLASTFGSFPYRVGYAYDYDKRQYADYQARVDTSRIITPENGGNVSHLRGASRAAWNDTELRNVLLYARAKGMKVHHAHLFWPKSDDIPTWLVTEVNAAPDATAAKNILSAYLVESTTRTLTMFKNEFADVVVSANVTNEAIYDGDGLNNDPSYGGKFKENLFKNYFTYDEVLELLMTTCYEVYPDIDYYICDYNQETSNEKQSDTYKAAIATLKAKNIQRNGKLVQVNGMAFQMHTNVNLDITVFKKRLKYWVDLGLKVMISELDVLTLTTTLTAAAALKQANAFSNIIIAYERVVPQSQRGGIILWTVTDKFYLENIGKQAPESTTNPIQKFPAPHDYYGQPKLAWQAMLDTVNREELSQDVFQDFLATGPVSPLDGTSTKGKTPLVWQKVGNAANIISVNDVGVGSPQNSNNVYNFAIVDYPFANRTVYGKLQDLPSATRTTMLVVRFVDANNYIGIQATNTGIWQIIRRSSATGSNVDTVLYASTIVPAKLDTVKSTVNGDAISLYINGSFIATVNDSSFLSATKCGLKFKGYDDKFTRWSEFSVNHL